MTIKIRKASAKDAKAFLSLVHALADYEKLDPPSPSAERRLVQDIFARESKKKKLNLLLAFSDHKAIGYALYFFTYSSFLARPTLYLEDIFVLEEFRGKKIGKSLFLHLAKEAKRGGCGRMEWSVLTWNKSAIGFYEKMGARRLDEWHYYRLDQDKIASLATA